MSLNKLMLIGHVGKDPDIRILEAGSKVATFSFATTEKGYTLANGTQVPERTEWHNIVVWRGLADVVEKYVHKGDKLYLEGKIRTRSMMIAEELNGILQNFLLIIWRCFLLSLNKRHHRHLFRNTPIIRLEVR